MEKKLKITNKKQSEVLTSLMEKNIHLAKGFKKGLNKIDFDHSWNSIATKINSYGPPIRDGKGWQKVWADLKYKVKRKLVHNNKKSRATNGGKGNFKQTILSPKDEAIVNLLSFEKITNPKGTAMGVSNTSTVRAQSPDCNTNYPSTSRAVSSPIPSQWDDFPKKSAIDVLTNSPTPSISLSHQTGHAPAHKKRTNSRTQTSSKTNREILSTKETEVQENLYLSIEKSLKNIEKMLKESERCNKKRLKIEEERLSIYKEEVKRNELHRIEHTKWKMMDFELRRKQNELQRRALNF